MIGKQWDEPMFMAAIEENAGVEVRSRAEQLLRWVTPQVTDIFWGQGQKNSCVIPTIRKGESAGTSGETWHFRMVRDPATENPHTSPLGQSPSSP